MAGRECYHCKQWIEDGEEHDCWTTTEEALTQDLSDDLRDAWERLRETAVCFGDQRIYASHKSIMFSRKHCYFFVRPKRNFLELCVFLGRQLKASQVRRVDRFRSPSSITSFTSSTVMKWRLPLLIGSRKPMSCRTYRCQRFTQSRSGDGSPNRRPPDFRNLKHPLFTVEVPEVFSSSRSYLNVMPGWSVAP